MKLNKSLINQSKTKIPSAYTMSQRIFKFKIWLNQPLKNFSNLKIRHLRLNGI